ncbi:MAG: efflux RND transporter periplasmic adaptor subunit [bacterium]
MKKTIIFIIIIVIAVVFFFLIKGKRNNDLEVKVVEVKYGNLIATVSNSGTLRSNKEINLTTAIFGKINKIMVSENQTVNKGMILLKLETFDQAEKDYNRMKSLGEKGFVSLQQIELAKKQWENTFIIAPFSGTIVKKFIEEGEVLNGPAFLIADLNDMIVETNIDETEIGKVKTGQVAEVIIDAYKDIKNSGKVQFIAKTSLEIKEKGITYQVKVKLDPTNIILRLGMTADVNIKVMEKKNVLIVPYSAIGEEKEEFFVFVVENDKIKKRIIKTGIENYEYTEVISGLKEKEILVETNTSKLQKGQKIKKEKEQKFDFKKSKKSKIERMLFKFKSKKH